MNPRAPIHVRLWKKVNFGDLFGCWTYSGKRGSNDYGLLGDGRGKQKLAHRVAWEQVNGPVPDRMYICHRCDNPPCIRPDHLFVGTPSENMADCKSKGRMSDYKEPTRARGERQGSAVLTAEAVVLIRQRRAAGESLSSIARAYGVKHPTIRNVVIRKRWAHVP